jgi:two-component system response regulator HydG
VSAKKILVVDDDTTFLLMVQSFLAKKGYQTEVVSDPVKALQALEKSNFDLILSDYRMPEMDGMEFLSEINDREIDTPLILITSYGDIRLAVKAIKQGATEYITKPVNPDDLLALVKNVFNQSATKSEKAKHKKSITLETNPNNDGIFHGHSAATRRINEHIALVAPTQMTVLIEGESGTGKEFIARRIHQESDRKEGPFVAIDCGSLTNELAASELFGHIKGSFTGAAQDRQGQFEVAKGGTLFLDEVGNLNYDIQMKLLRAIQERVIRRVGGSNDIAVDVRILAATNENLSDAIKNGEFREDLFHRLNEFKIEVSPLRSRSEEILPFARHFLNLANAEFKKAISDFDDESAGLLTEYDWPGNLRELRNVVRRAALLSQGEYVEKASLPGEILTYDPKFNKVHRQSETDLKVLESSLERQKIVEALEKVHYNKTKAAKLLNIDRKTLYNKIRNYGLNV